MAQPQVPIDVDPETGIWRTDGLPMIYLPRHFLVNMLKGIEAAIGPSAYREILYASSDRIKRELGWNPQYEDIQVIVDTAWRWRVAHPHGYRGRANP